MGRAVKRGAGKIILPNPQWRVELLQRFTDKGTTETLKDLNTFKDVNVADIHIDLNNVDLLVESRDWDTVVWIQSVLSNCLVLKLIQKYRII